MKINGNNKKATVLTFNLKSMDTRMKLCAPSRLLPPHADLNNLNEATITFDDWCEIDDVIFSGPATVVKWKDGTKTVVKCNKGENFDPEKGLVIAITKKALGNKGNYYETIRKWMHPGVTVLKTITVKSNGVETEINKVSSDDIIKIINTGKPDGNFYCYSKKEKKYIAVDNTTGEAFTESFKDKKSCLDWLANKEKTV